MLSFFIVFHYVSFKTKKKLANSPPGGSPDFSLHWPLDGGQNSLLRDLKRRMVALLVFTA